MQLLFQKAPVVNDRGSGRFLQSSVNQVNYLIWVFIGLGIMFRVFHFIDNRSFWIDEVYLSTSLINMDFLTLATSSLEYEQKAPIGFLWMVRSMVLLFGNKEMALRLIPLLSGIASLFFFWPVARYFFKPLGVVVSMAILALAPPLIYHSVEAKQYSTELLMSVLALLLFVKYHKDYSFSSMLKWGIGGAVILWFSYSSIFVLAGFALAITFYLLMKKQWNLLLYVVPTFTFWLISFVVNYFLFTHKHADSEWLVFFFKGVSGFMPLPPTSMEEIKWFFKIPYWTLNYPLGLLWFFNPESEALRLILKMPFIPFFCVGLGVLMFYRENKMLFLALCFPFLLTLFASGLELYPFYERLIVFLTPLLICFIARGCEKMVDLFPSSSSFRYILPALLIAAPLASSARQVIDTSTFGIDEKQSYYKDALLHINDRYQEGDVVYVYWNFTYAYRYYKKAYSLKFDALEGRDVRAVSGNADEYAKNLEPDIKQLIGKKRVWLIYDKTKSFTIGDFLGQPSWYYQKEVRAGRLFHKEVKRLGKELEHFEKIDVSVSLHDLSVE